MLVNGLRESTFKMFVSTQKVYSVALEGLINATHWEVQSTSSSTSTPTTTATAVTSSPAPSAPQNTSLLQKPIELPKQTQVNAIQFDEERLLRICNTLDNIEKQFRATLPVDMQKRPEQQPRSHYSSSKPPVSCTYCSRLNHTVDACRKKQYDESRRAQHTNTSTGSYRQHDTRPRYDHQQPYQSRSTNNRPPFAPKSAQTPQQGGASTTKPVSDGQQQKN